MLAAAAPGAAAREDKGARPGSVVVHVEAKAKAGTKPGQGSPPPREDYGYPDADDGPFAGVEYKKLRNVVVWLEPAGPMPQGASAAGESPVVVAVGSKRPPGPAGPPLFVAGVGQRVQFRNQADDPVSVFSMAGANKISCRGIKPGERGEWVAVAPGEMDIFTDNAPEPCATLVVAPTKFVERTRGGEDVKFEGVPAGEWRVRGWHTHLPARDAQATVKEGKRAEVTLTLTVDALPEAP